MKRASTPILAGAGATIIAAGLGLLAPGVSLETALGTAIIPGAVTAALTTWSTQEAKEKNSTQTSSKDEETQHLPRRR